MAERRPDLTTPGSRADSLTAVLDAIEAGTTRYAPAILDRVKRHEPFLRDRDPGSLKAEHNRVRSVLESLEGYRVEESLALDAQMAATAKEVKEHTRQAKHAVGQARGEWARGEAMRGAAEQHRLSAEAQALRDEGTHLDNWMKRNGKDAAKLIALEGEWTRQEREQSAQQEQAAGAPERERASDDDAGLSA